MTNTNVVLVARAVALYLLCWIGSELTYLPNRVHGLYHYMRSEHVSTGQYLRDTYVLELGFALIRVLALFLVAGWLYRCGPRVRAFFMQVPDDREAEDSGRISDGR
jgi:hypothetical protein